MTKHNVLKNRAILAQGSYCHWATEEIERYIAQNKGRPIIEVIEEFRHRMDCFACNAKTAEANFMFSVAYDVATDMLDEVINNIMTGESK